MPAEAAETCRETSSGESISFKQVLRRAIPQLPQDRLRRNGAAPTLRRSAIRRRDKLLKASWQAVQEHQPSTSPVCGDTGGKSSRGCWYIRRRVVLKDTQNKDHRYRHGGHRSDAPDQLLLMSRLAAASTGPQQVLGSVVIPASLK